MITLFEENETLFQSIGLGLLKDAKSCIVKEELNNTFELELQYPINGQYFSELKINRIITAKPNPYAESQPFRIYTISKPINGLVTVKAFHISYDMNGIVVGPINGATPKLALDQIQNGSILDHNFKLYTDIISNKSFKTTNYYNMRALLLGSSESILETYKGEIYFDKFNTYILTKRGSNKGASIRYAKNMKDITHDISYDRLYNGVYPFYHQEVIETTAQSTTSGFKAVYIVGSKPFQDGWLSYTPDGEPYHPVDESPVQIASEGSYYEKVYCWNTNTQRYVEKIYNEMVNVIECITGMIGISDAPQWIYIDVSGLPNIVIKAAEPGYFKLATDNDWTHHIKGEIVFEGSIVNASEGLIMYYSEVIPTESSATETESTSITHVELDDKILYIDSDAAKSMKYDRILCLDLTSEFEEAPSKEELEAKAKEYIEENKIGQYKYETTVSFVDLASTTEGTKYDKLETIELGDTVKVVYEDLGIDIDLRVISTTYNVILNRYVDIYLGEKPEKLSANSVQTGDDVSSLTNDVGYADITTVNKLIAKTVTAELIQAKNASLTKAQIEELQTARIKVTGLIEATQFELDTLVAKMLTADNAVIKQTLEAGTVKVKGDITVTKGQITIENTDYGTVFKVDRDGNVTANSVSITGGELNINNMFTVTPEGFMSAQNADIQGTIRATSGIIGGFTVTEGNLYSGTIGRSNSVMLSPGYVATISTLDSNEQTWAILADGYFGVTSDGKLYAQNAKISGTIEAKSGSIAGFIIEQTASVSRLYSLDDNDNISVLMSPGYYAQVSALDTIPQRWAFLASDSFGVTKDGTLYTKDIRILGGSINITNQAGTQSFNVNSNGELSANAVRISGGYISITNGSTQTFSVTSDGELTANVGNIGGFTISNDALYKDISSFNQENVTSGVYLGTDGIRVGSQLKIWPSGKITSGDVSSDNTACGIDTSGRLVANNATIKGTIQARDGEIGGFIIQNDGLYSGFDELDNAGDQATISGVYVGKDGIRLGQNLTNSLHINVGTIGGTNADMPIIHLINGTDDTNYLGTAFTLSFDAAPVRRYIEITEYDKDPTDITANILYKHDNKPSYNSFIARPIINIEDEDLNKFSINSNDFTYIDASDERFIGQSGYFNGFTLLFKCDAPAISIVEVRAYWLTDAEWAQIQNDPTIQLQIDPSQEILINRTITPDGTSFEIIEPASSAISTISSPHLALKLSQDTVLHNCVLTEKPKQMVEIPPNVTSIQTTFLYGKWVQFVWNNAEINEHGVTSTGVYNTNLDLNIMPGFLVTPDGMLNAYNAKIYGSLYGDVQIIGGSISIGASNASLINYLSDSKIEEHIDEIPDWTNNTDYGRNDYVKFIIFYQEQITGSVYRCIQPHTSSLISRPGIGRNWELYWIFINNYSDIDQYTQDTSYSSGTLITYKNSVYRLNDNYDINDHLSLELTKDICTILGIESSDDKSINIDNIVSKIPGVGYQPLTQQQLIEVYSICGVEYKSTVFNVDTDGKITATAGNIAGYDIDETSIHKGNIGTTNSVWMSIGKTATISKLDSNQKIWAFTANNTFGVTTSGELYATAGKIGNLAIYEHSIGYNFDPENPYSGTIAITDDGYIRAYRYYIPTYGQLYLENGYRTITSGHTKAGTIDSYGIKQSVNISGGQGSNSAHINLGDVIGTANIFFSGVKILCEVITHSGSGTQTRSYDYSNVFTGILGAFATYKTSDQIYENQSVHVNWSGTNVSVYWNNHTGSSQVSDLCLLVIGYKLD